ncbi:LytTR family DNA-binding domain-containing protein [Roseivirga sp. E12]|uniref:LytR/AlgR family response regulator transcription factor n=1 Tax=Roseivirga sp. E12 TaxID=2819237 RepID=UPI001ABD40E0|nr:LytTR family DNA-binding domain-containing protein [Roseivirga sp. E12]MBO3697396.1 response regulator transcription factor [Roseivirga sp. E12]
MIYSAIIVDDEPHARRYLSELIAKDPEIKLAGEFRNGKEALNYLSSNKVDIVFLDIEMPNVNGLEVANGLTEGANQNAVIIFTTAYNQYAITAFEAQALDYLLKPFDELRFTKALNRAKTQVDLQGQDLLHHKIADLYDNFKKSKSPQIHEFVIKEKGLEFSINTSKIIAIEASGVYAILITKQKGHLYRIALNDLESNLPSSFLRIHRSSIVNLDHLSKFKYLNNSTFEFSMDNEKVYVSGRSYQSRIKSVLSEKGL